MGMVAVTLITNLELHLRSSLLPFTPMQVMEEEKHKEAYSFMPVVPRLDRLDRLLQVLEEKHSFSRRDHNNPSWGSDGCKTVSSALEEVQHKGTILDRVALLETRVLQLSLEMYEENTSKSSSSTFQVFPKETGKDVVLPRQPVDGTNLTPPEMHNATFFQPEEATSSDGEFVTKRTEQHKSKSKGTNCKSKQKWLRLFRFRFTC